MSRIRIYSYITVTSFSPTVKIELHICEQIAQYGECSTNSACSCFHRIGTNEGTDICGFLWPTCSQLVPCNSSDNSCTQSNTIYVPHHQCYPIAMIDQKMCPPMIIFNTCGNNNGECIDPFAASTVPPVTMSTTTTILVPTLTIGGFIIFVCLIVVCYIYNIRRLRQSRISAVNTMNQTVVYQNAQQSTGESTVLFDVQSHYNSNTSTPFPPNSARPEAPPPPYEAANTNSLIKCPSESPPPPYEIATIEQTIT
ncbi:unnamed protein product [Adineta steineri]|uniref:Uncharacterized protein n=2 Tax=Adineta steineri TaxID=433720 RepID=A0A819H3Y9_9BILA|nr:unnamed protein product [Adineta steineri]CAF3820730.1 unnamed protein product [Adineta steineri]CAF3891857.1 unnamed protein product [Adineta steineri]